MTGGLLAAGVTVGHGAYNARCRAVRSEHCLQQVGGGRLAIGAGDSDQTQLAGGMAIERVRQLRQGAPGVGHAHTGDVGRGATVERAVNDKRDGYNRYYVLEKACALRSDTLARLGFSPLPPMDLAELRAHLPPLPVPRLAG